MLYNGSVGAGGIGNLNDRLMRRRMNGLQRPANAPSSMPFGKVETAKSTGNRMPSTQARIQNEGNDDARAMMNGLGLMEKAAKVKEKLAAGETGGAEIPLKKPFGYAPVTNEAGELTLAAAENAPKLAVQGTAPTANLTGDVTLQAAQGELPAWGEFLKSAAAKPADLIAANMGADAAAKASVPLAGEILPSVTGAGTGALAGLGGAGMGAAGLEALNAGGAALAAGALGAEAAALSPEMIALMIGLAPIGL